MEIVAVSDANIFIDLADIGLLDDFFSLPWEIHTTDMIVHELKEIKEKARIIEYRTKGRLCVKEHSEQEMLKLTKFHTTQRLPSRISIQDCSIWLYAMENNYTMLTGDAKLRKVAEKKNVDVHGIFYVIDKIVACHLRPHEDVADKLKKLKIINPRLPLSEIEKRIKNWGS